MGQTHTKNKAESNHSTSSHKILLIGSNDSGKDAIFKQIHEIYRKNPMQKSDIALAKKHIQDSVIKYMNILCKESQFLHAEYGKQTLVNIRLVDYRQDLIDFAAQPPYDITSDIAMKIQALWNDKGIQNTWQLRHYYQIPETAKYFFNKCPIILSDDYVHPQTKMNFYSFFEDYLRICTPFIGTQAIHAAIGQYAFELISTSNYINNSQYSIHETCDAVLYVIPISDYDVNILNGLTQSINLFHHLLVSNVFQNKSLFLVFNNYDLFEQKIRRKPITVTFDDFDENMNPNDKDCVFTFILEKILKMLAHCNYDSKMNGTVNILRVNGFKSQEMDIMLKNIAIYLVKKQRSRQTKRQSKRLAKYYKYDPLTKTDLCVSGYAHRYMRRKRLFIPKTITQLFIDYVGVLVDHCVDFDEICT